MRGDHGTKAVPSVDHELVWDPHALTLIVGDNPQQQQRLISKFVSNAEDLMSQIAEFTAEGDTGNCVKVAHHLKSSSRTMGAMRLSSLCQHLENMGKLSNADATRETASVLRLAYSEFLTAIDDESLGS